MSDVTITVTVHPDVAWALAQFVKRVGWSEFRENAQDDDEAYLIKSGCEAIQTALATAGFSPR